MLRTPRFMSDMLVTAARAGQTRFWLFASDVHGILSSIIDLVKC